MTRIALQRMTRMPRRPRSGGRHGFTLIELVIALTLTAIAATIAGTAVSAARRTEEVVQAHRIGDEADLRLRALLQDMLRHAPAAAQADAPLLSLSGPENAATLVFLSRGVQAPFGTGPIWQVRVWRDADSLRVEAAPTRTTGDAPLRMAIGGVSSLQVEALEPATALDGARWRRDWSVATARPAALSLTWTRGRSALAPLVVALDPLPGGAR
jgi:prepilin-type N-terminal cleavage/methylation domain-containing protein